MLGHSQYGPWLSCWFLQSSTFTSWNEGCNHTGLLPLPYTGNEKASVLSCSASSPSPKGWSGVNRGCHQSPLQDSRRICLWEVLANYFVLMSSSSIGTPLGCRAPQTSVCRRGRMRRDGAVRWRLWRTWLPVPLKNGPGQDQGPGITINHPGWVGKWENELIFIFQTQLSWIPR